MECGGYFIGSTLFFLSPVKLWELCIRMAGAVIRKRKGETDYNNNGQKSQKDTNHSSSLHLAPRHEFTGCTA